jgi:putative transposase
MGRAGVADHPSEWSFGGYHEVQTPHRRYVLVAYEKLAELAGWDTSGPFQALHKQWANDSLGSLNNVRNSRRAQGIAAGGRGLPKMSEGRTRFKSIRQGNSWDF